MVRATPNTSSLEFKSPTGTDTITETAGSPWVEVDPGNGFLYINGLEPGTRYTFSVKGHNGSGSGPEATSARHRVQEPTHWWGHQADHTVRFTRGSIDRVNGSDIIGNAILPAARAWNALITDINGHRHGLLICNGSDISCDDSRGNNLNRDTREVTIMTEAPANGGDITSGCGTGYACVDDAPAPVSGQAHVGSHMTNMDMIFENPAYYCSVLSTL